MAKTHWLWHAANRDGLVLDARCRAAVTGGQTIIRELIRRRARTPQAAIGGNLGRETRLYPGVVGVLSSGFAGQPARLGNCLLNRQAEDGERREDGGWVGAGRRRPSCIHRGATVT